MQKLELILSMAATIVGLTVTTVTFLTKFIRNAKAKRIAENVVEIGNALLPYIEEAEKFVSYTGTEKKAYVMTKANQYAIERKIKFDAEATSRKIDELVALTLQVNSKAPAGKFSLDAASNGGAAAQAKKIIIGKRTEENHNGCKERDF